ncbi:PilW family protein [Pyxidicoccus xibeiensis]|uniref:PilW family protein n=1 Tax=Pyxidicoccus xibeiensis TaxID=2906759 RepID=UPI0020A789F1|nr:PilW family protein [Pyxidicoccus xibeiensis]MCP3138955.1 PilW family protein [Pyxidicoccus xibeiensis]
MRRPSQARSAGFTLLEVLIGTTISSVVLLAVAATVIGVNSVFQGNSLSKQTVEGSRVGMDYLKRTLRLAGYGLDPALAFDFNTAGLPGNAKDNFVQDLTPWGTVITDDLAFRYRDPMYLRRGHVSGSGPYTLNLEAGTSFGQGFRLGQTLLLACPGGLEYFLGRLNADALATANTAALTAVPESPALPACLTNADRPAFVLLVHEKRLRVESFGGRPYLVVRHGWAADSDFDPLVANVESFQVAYQMNRPPASSTCCVGQAAPDATEGTGTSWLLGDEDVALLPNTGPTRPTYDTQYDAVERYTAHPANIRAVRVGLTVRSSRQQPSQARELEPPPRLLNAPAPAGTDAFFRSTVETSIRVPNMTSRTFFIPDLRNPTDATSKKNVGGG